MKKMTEIRHRKLQDDTTSTSVEPRARAQSQPIRFRRLFVCLVVVVVAVTYVLGLFASQNLLLDGLANTLGYTSEYHYAVIIDAGSSGSRVLAYRFRVPFTVFNRANLQLESEYFEQSKPGLSSYADEPEKGAQSIVRLIENAQIPVEARSRTPLIVRATAGLRLLPAEQADKLIATVRAAIQKLKYAVESDAVEIMAGADEGIYIWYTINLLRDSLQKDNSMTALDLGGGSTQITYRADAAPDVTAGYHAVPLVDRNLTLYTHSYLNLGLYASRLAILRLESTDVLTTNLTSSCVEPIIKNELWHYGNRDYYISGAPRNIHVQPKEAFLKCREIVARHVRHIMYGDVDTKPPSPPNLPVAAMSFFYDIAADAGIIDVMKGGSITVDQYRLKALTACSSSNVEQPFSCLDLVFVVSLLRDGYKFDDKKKIHLFKKVDDHEVSWALGLAYTTVTNRINKH